MKFAVRAQSCYIFHQAALKHKLTEFSISGSLPWAETLLLSNTLESSLDPHQDLKREDALYVGKAMVICIYFGGRENTSTSDISCKITFLSMIQLQAYTTSGGDGS